MFFRLTLALLLNLVSVSEAIEFRCATVTDGSFYSERGLDRYREYFRHTGFSNELTRLTESDTWIDMGSGEGNAIREALALSGFRGKVMGVTVAAPQALLELILLKQRNPRFQFKFGKYLEEIDTADLPRAALISDLFGPFSYAQQPDEIIRRYLEVLEVGGSAHVFYAGYRNYLKRDQPTTPEAWVKDFQSRAEYSLGANYGAKFTNGEWTQDEIQFRLKHHQGLGVWLRSIKGVVVEFFGENAFKITKISALTEVPTLEQISYIEAAPSLRNYRVKR